MFMPGSRANNARFRWRTVYFSPRGPDRSVETHKIDGVTVRIIRCQDVAVASSIE